MKILSNRWLIAMAVSGALLSGCSDDDDSDNDDSVVTSDFAFATQAPADYSRVDRAGMPAIATALIVSKDAYNEANPVDDIAGTFVPEILNSLTFLHGALDAQLIDLGLTPCTVVGDGTGTCAATAVPLILPDTLKLDTASDAGFPNGRLLSDPVVDVTLAVALLELSGDPAPHAATALVGVLNPPANDLAFQTEFPFVAAPH